jgi:hypothetical protein
MTKPSLLLLTALMIGCGREGSPIASPIAPSAVPSPATSLSLSGVVSEIDADGCPWPLREARIRIDTASAGVFQTVTDEHGRYVIQGLPLALCEITVERDGYEPVRRSLQLSGDAVMNFELVPRG